MLPPVSAVTNSSMAFQDPRAAQDGAAEEAVRPRPLVPQAANALEQNAAIAGRLNLLMLSGREQVSENLALLVDLLGARLGMERLEGEAPRAYIGRLVQALGELAPQARQSVQRQLSQMFGGMQLRTLMEAFRNPAGPEAATLAVYLELHRIKDKDLAARTVITSYRQNAGESRPATMPLAAPIAATPMSPAATTAQPSGPPAQPQQVPQQQATQSEDMRFDGEVPDDPMAPVARGRLFSMPDERSSKVLKLAAARALQTAMAHGGARIEPRLPAEQATPELRRGSDGIDPPKDLTTRQDGKRVSEADVPMAQSRRGAEESGEAAGTVGRVIPAEMIEAEAGPVPSKTASHAEKADPIALLPSAEFGEEQPDTQEQPKVQAKTETLFVLKGWTEEDLSGADALLPSPLPTDGDVGPDPARVFGFGQAGSTENEKAPQDIGLTAGQDDFGAGDTGQAEHAVDDTPEELESAAANAESVEGEPSPQESTASELPDSEIALQRQTVIGREGVPLPVINYLFAADEIAEKMELKHRFSDEQGEEANEDGAEDFAEDPGDDETEGEEQEDTGARQELSDDGGAGQIAAGVEGETPNDLYWRMAGWS